MAENTKPAVYLVDASGYIFRAYHAIRGGMSTKEGLPTNAVFGFTQMLLKLLKDETPVYLVPVFDVSRKSFRTDLFPAYKANRPEPPEDLIVQFPLVRDVVRALGLPAMELANYEADDLIGTLAARLAREGHPVRIVTSDKDMMQLVAADVWLIDTWKEKIVRRPEVEERFGVGPERVIDVLGLAGDTSDNIPGVPGIGEKTAIGLIQEFGDLEGVLANAGKVKGAKRQESLREFAEQARLSRLLATIKCDVPLDFDLEAFRVKGPDRELAPVLFRKLEFNRLLQQLDFEVEPATSTIDRDKYVLVDSLDKLDALIRSLQKSDLIAFDTETRSIDPFSEAPLVGMSFSPAEGEAYYVPVDHRLPNMPQPPKPEALARLKPLFADPKRCWVMQNAKFDLAIMRREGIEFAGRVDDTMLMSYSENPARRSHGLDAMTLDLLGHKMIAYEEVVGKGKNQITFDYVDGPTACRYSAEDADATRRLYALLGPRLDAEGVRPLYETLERPLVPVLMQMEADGIRVDRAALESLTASFDRMLVELEKQIHEAAGLEFNVNSTKQLGEVLFEKIGLPKGRKTKTKSGYSTDSSVLEKLIPYHPLPGFVLDYRQTAKLRSTYSDALVKLIHPLTGRIHTSYNQTVALTGRLSSSDPNLQNIPVRTPAGRLIRQAFVPEDGAVLVSADYSQVELRILAHLSGDAILIDSFKRGEDIHRRTAAEVFDTMPQMVDAEMRRRAKAVNFGIAYGQTAFGLAESLGIPNREAKKIIDNYFARYAGIRRYIDEQQERGRREKVVHTLFGRRIPLTDIDSPTQAMRGYSERVAINAPIQGTAADIIKAAMIAIHDTLARSKLKSRMLLQVHDELVFEVPESEIDALKALIVEKMEGAANLAVPLKVDVGLGPNWDAAH
ncbi:MAG: DNA polymerase I [Myxococcales bacterium]|nr:MAG: DNA polymerase I [Myxococcales bacterium]